ncbi:MAG: Stress responsive Barrel Domain [Frankiales bacterium]|nr:Stress responsive Barrel Domain [Frankiales bacterium]
MWRDVVLCTADTALVADVADQAAFRRYATDPRHLEIVGEHVRPWPAARIAVQY